jgi:DNA-binding HxlR family transcriptional regulator
VDSIFVPTRLGYRSRVSTNIESAAGQRPTGPRVCSIADALELVGDRWSLLVLREIGLGVRRFKDIRTNTGAPPETLTTRLRQLEEGGVVIRQRYCERPPRDEYVLTEAGQDILPVLGALRQWGEKHATPLR